MAPQLFYLQVNSRFLFSQKILQRMDHCSMVSKIVFCFIFKKDWGDSIIILYVPTKAPIAREYVLFPHPLEAQANSVNQQGFERMHTYLPKHMAFSLALICSRGTPALLPLDYHQPSFLLHFCLFRIFVVQFLHPNLSVIR